MCFGFMAEESAINLINETYAFPYLIYIFSINNK